VSARRRDELSGSYAGGGSVSQSVLDRMNMNKSASAKKTKDFKRLIEESTKGNIDFTEIDRKSHRGGRKDSLEEDKFSDI